MFENLIKNDFKGKYAPPFYKIPEYMREEPNNYAEQNLKNFNEMKGAYLSPNEMNGGKLTTLNRIIQNNENIDDK